MFQDKLNNYLVVRIEMSTLFHIEYFNLPNFELIDEIFCVKTLSTYSRLNSKVLFGFEDGSLHLDQIKHIETKEINNRMPS